MNQNRYGDLDRLELTSPPRPSTPPRLFYGQNTDDYSQQPHVQNENRPYLKSSNSSNSRGNLAKSRSLSRFSENTATDKSGKNDQRIIGARRTVKHLKREVSEKDRIIQSLENEIHLHTQSVDSSLNSFQKKVGSAHNSITHNRRKKEKELKKILDEQAAKITQDKKSIGRMKELNKTLTDKLNALLSKQATIEDLENQNKIAEIQMKSNQDEHGDLMKCYDELQAKVYDQDKTIELQQTQYDMLVAQMKEFESASRIMYKANKMLEAKVITALETEQV